MWPLCLRSTQPGGLGWRPLGGDLAGKGGFNKPDSGLAHARPHALVTVVVRPGPARVQVPGSGALQGDRDRSNELFNFIILFASF